MKIRSIVILIGLLGITSFSKGQTPDWQVDLSQFAFRMTVSAVLEHDNQLLGHEGNKVALFVGEDIRGVGSTDVYHEPTGRYLAIFQVASNAAEGENLTVRFYNETNDEILNARVQVAFVANELIGTVNEPMIFSDNRFPSAIEIDGSKYSENLETDVVVGNLFTSDPDDDQHEYKISRVEPTEAVDYLKIEGDQLMINEPANFEEVDSFEIEIVSTDPMGGQITEIFTFQIRNENDLPTDIFLSDLIIDENSPIGTKVGKLSTEDEDFADTFIYEIIPGNESLDYTYFKIIGDEIFTEKPIDRELTTDYTLEIVSTDNSGASVSKTINLIVGDVNEPPIVNDTAFQIAENINQVMIGRINAEDPDVGQSLTFEFAGATENIPFQLDANSGEITVTAPLDFELKNIYQLVVKIIDSGLPSISEIIQLQIVVEDLNESPTDILMTNQSLNENEGANFLIGTLETVDEDEAEFFDYQIQTVNGNDVQNSFSLVNGKIYAQQSFDFESLRVYELVISSADKAGLTIEKSFEILINDLNEAPVITDTVFQVNEMPPANTRIGQVNSSDEDIDEKLIFQFLDNEEIPFSIDPATAEIYVDQPEIIDYEEKESWILKMIVSDSGNPVMRDTAIITIEIEDVPENNFLPFNNYISPNGDQVNDFFEIENVQIYESFLLKIFTPQGKVIYQNDAYDNSWEGRWNGRLLPAGTYYFTFESGAKNISYSGKIFLKDR